MHIITDRLRSYSAAIRTSFATWGHERRLERARRHLAEFADRLRYHDGILERDGASPKSGTGPCSSEPVARSAAEYSMAVVEQ